jgi:hypothetical protein
MEASVANKKQAEEVVQQLLRDTKPGRDEHNQRVSRYNRAYDVWRPSVKSIKSPYPWASKIRVPWAMQVLDTALVNIAQGAPRCRVLPRTPEDAVAAKPFQVILDYYTQQDHLAKKYAWVVQQALIYGITIGKNHWLYKEGRQQQKVYEDHPLTGELLQSQQQADVITYDGPSFEPWDVYDAWWDPNGRDVDSCQYFVLRSWPSKQDILRSACTVKHDHPPEECNGIYHNVPELLDSGTRKRQDSTSQEEYLGSWKNKRKDTYEVWEVWQDDHVTVIGNKQVLLRDGLNPHWFARKPIVAACTRPDLFQIQGIPETELVDHLQQALWTNQNLREENMLLTVHRGITYRETGVIDPNALELKPRFKWPVSDHEDIVFQQPPPLPSEAYTEEQTLLGNMQTVTGITPYVSGADMSGVDQNTATGVTTLAGAASRLLQFKAGMIQLGVWQRTFEQWGAMIQQYMDRPQWVRITGSAGELLFRQVHPTDVAGDFDFHLVGIEESLSKQQERTEAMSLLNSLAPFAQMGFVNMRPLIEKVAQAFDFENPEELFNQPQPPGAAAPSVPGQPSAAPPPPGQPAPAGGNGTQLPGAQGNPAMSREMLQQLFQPRQQ